MHSSLSYPEHQEEKDIAQDEKFIMESHEKVDILLQAYISNAYIEDFALVSDSAYAAQVCHLCIILELFVQFYLF